MFHIATKSTHKHLSCARKLQLDIEMRKKKQQITNKSVQVKKKYIYFSKNNENFYVSLGI